MNVKSAMHPMKFFTGLTVLLTTILFSACSSTVTIGDELTVTKQLSVSTSNSANSTSLTRTIDVSATVSEAPSKGYSWTINGSSLSSAKSSGAISSYSQSYNSLSITVPDNASENMTIALTIDDSVSSTTIDANFAPLHAPNGDNSSKSILFAFQNPGSSNVDADFNVSSSVNASSTIQSSKSYSPTSNSGISIAPPPSEITAFNQKAFTGSVSSRSVQGSTYEGTISDPSYSAASLGDTVDFITDDGTVSASLRYTSGTISTDNGNKVVQIWVGSDWEATLISGSDDLATGTDTDTDSDGIPDIFDTNESDTGSPGSDYILDTYGAYFLTSGSDNDIYDLVAGLLGEEWGATGYNNVISETDIIDILLYDIGDDFEASGSKTVGYFWAKDNFTSDYYSSSNERIMFYMDAPFLSYADSFWTDSETYFISTLAHEFQHMINFYQRSILKGSSDGTWMNEMMSMMVEDLVADELSSITGLTIDPPTDRLVEYAYEPEDQLTAWGSETVDYATSYSFGSYLLRNAGAEDFLIALMDASASDTAAVEEAIAEMGGSMSYEDAFGKWVAAALVSYFDDTSTSGYSYYGSGFSPYILDDIDIGDIVDAYNSSYSTSIEMYINDISYWQNVIGNTLKSGASYFFTGASPVSGTESFSFTVPEGSRIGTILY